ncbi:RDD family protein [Clostridium sp. MSJ-4]|uniref:RDD family protein n=1 Tax=Clostridium simiarum TaxID=2841506 RepID=A0ABS6F2H6_9CLOT|nr:RDD family protein [Clostridium simiarum]MBU5592712.1 RDD family protein [Clostridium simiarum]
MLENESKKNNIKKEDNNISAIEEDKVISKEESSEKVSEGKERALEKEGSLNNEDKNIKHEEKEIVKGKEEKVTFFESIQATIIDQIVIGGASFILIIIFDFVIKFIGLRVTDKMGIYFIMYIILNIVYSPIMEKTKMKNTLGRKISKIKLVNN